METTNSILVEVEEAVGVTSKTIGTLLQDQLVQAVDNILTLETSHHNMLLLNSNIHNNILALLKVLYSSRQRKKRIVKIYSDHLRTFKLRIKRPLRR